MASSSVGAAVRVAGVRSGAQRATGAARGLAMGTGSSGGLVTGFAVAPATCDCGCGVGRVLAAGPGDPWRGAVLVVGAGQKSAHEILVLVFHQHHERLLEPGLAGEILVRCSSGGEDGPLVVEQRDHDRIAYPVIFGLHVVGLSAVLKVGIEPGHHCHYLRAKEYSTNAAVPQLFVRLVFFDCRRTSPGPYPPASRPLPRCTALRARAARAGAARQARPGRP